MPITCSSTRSRLAALLAGGLLAVMGLMGLMGLGCNVAVAQTASATVRLTHISYQVVDLNPDNGISPWVWVPSYVDWLPQTASVSAQVDAPTLSQLASGWLGAGQSASVAASDAQASAWVGLGDLSSGASGSATVSASDGLSATAIAQIFSGRFLAGADTGLIFTATVEELQADAAGGLAQAVASLVTYNIGGSGVDISQAMVFDAPGFYFSDLNGTLTVSWSNASSDAVWGQLDAVVSAQVLSVSAVPEPTTSVMLAVGGLGLLAARRRASRVVSV
jgi:hypothetical protein